MNDAINPMRPDLLPCIVARLEDGGRLTEAIIDYIASALFFPESERLADFLADDGASERDSLLDLIYFPDQAVQIDMEPLLDAACYAVDDETRLHARLAALPIDARVCMPDGRQLIRLRMPDFIKSRYLERLRITWQLDPQVATAIDTGVSAQRGPVVKVRLRNAGISLTPSRRSFLTRFFERMPDSDPDYLACLDLTLSLIKTADEAADVYDLLAGHKRSLFRCLQQTQRFETLLGQSNMETLMLQGVRASHASRDELVYHMRLVDMICLRIFGTTENIPLPFDEPLREVTDLQSPEAAVRTMWR